MKPVTRIHTSEDLNKWIDSKTYNEVLDFVIDLQNLVLGLTNDQSKPTSVVLLLITVLDRIEAIVHENPVLKEKNVSRFGKVEFRDFYDQVQSESDAMLKEVCSEHVSEVGAYLTESFGNRTRIDYGSGHELNFMCFLLSLQKTGVIDKNDYTSLILSVFTKYIKIMRILQKTYWLEPAGSHGVWGLDDYHFLPFLFGASQLATHPFMKPKLIHNDELVELYHDKYMYFECIHFLNTIKTVPNNQQKLSLRWHSPMLDDILSAKSWEKIKEGMIKMYKAEVLGKLPIVQHFMFGNIIQCPDGIPEHHDEEEDEHEHHDHGNTWGDCCGIKIPSAIAASELLKLQKSIPFD